ncbi:IPTL-CTERM sorting domain-containing protein [Marinobacterium sp. BA1]|uniref:IPTL-CTERM sorting domain-containing protein n=1 Tax=Marinobacterium sp. BA1 TaxID=3138931 RepID=UPI0032E7EE39
MYNRLPVFGAALLLATQATAAIQVNIEPTTLLTNEDGSAVTYFVVLDQAPSAGETVTVTPSSGDVTEGTVSGAVLFTDANWDVPQTITVTPGASGDGNDGDVMYTIGHTTTAAGGTASFNGAPSPNVSATNRNIEGINTIVMDPASGGAFYLTEGTSQTVTVSVTGAPTNNISIDVSIAGAEATVTPATVILTAGNGYAATFNVTAADDTNIDGDQPFTVVVDPAVSADLSYSGQNLSDINGVALDNDVATPPPAPAQVTPVPTLPLFGILALSGLLGLFGMFGMRKTKA